MQSKLLAFIAIGLIVLNAYALAKNPPPAFAAQPALTTPQGGTGTSSPSGILYGDGTLRMKTVTIGSSLTFSGGTLSATESFAYPFPSNATTTGLMLLASTTIGAGGQATGLTISGGATTTGTLRLGTSGNGTIRVKDSEGLVIANGGSGSFRLLNFGGDLFFQNTNTSGNMQFTGNVGADLTGDIIFKTTGNVGISTTSPYAKLSVVGETVAEYFTATSTSATSSAPRLSVSTALSVIGDYILGLFGAGLGTDSSGELAVTGLISKPYVPQIAPDVHLPLDTVLTDWYSNGGSVEADSDEGDFIDGDASFHITTDGGGSLEGGRLNITDDDWSARHFSVWVKALDWDRVNSAEILISTDGLFTAYFLIDLVDYLVTPADDEWIEVVFTESNLATGAGSPDLATANDMIFRATDDSGGAAQVWYDGFSVFQRATTTGGIVSVVWDDGDDEQYDVGARYLDQYGYKSTYYVIYDELTGGTRMTQAEVDLLHKKGNEIGGHVGTSLCTLASAALTKELDNVRAYLIEHGYGNGFAYPEGCFDDEVVQEVSARFGYGRNISFLKQSPTYVSPYGINAVSPNNTTGTTTLEGWVDDAVANDEWLIINLHKITQDNAGSTDMQTLKFEHLIDYLDSSGAQVLPVEQVLNRYWEPAD